MVPHDDYENLAIRNRLESIGYPGRTAPGHVAVNGQSARVEKSIQGETLTRNEEFAIKICREIVSLDTQASFPYDPSPEGTIGSR